MHLPQSSQKKQKKQKKRREGLERVKDEYFLLRSYNSFLKNKEHQKMRPEKNRELEKRENQISAIILDAAIAIHSVLGPGLIESAYEACLCYELNSRGLKFQNQVPLPIKYGNVTLSTGYRMDFVVEDLVIVELKAVEKLIPLYDAQLLSHLKLSGKKLGLLINFHVLRLQDGFKRIANGL
ncbi:MAG TPA: GxxExxY protein [Candidatus Angelobacter sp.]|nr:GxxExxY protein [Candidatus Angelobacter sp.]